MDVEPESRTEREALTLEPGGQGARHALEARIALAAERLFADLNRFPIVVRSAAGAIERGVVIALGVGAVLVLGAVALLVRRVQRHRVRISWR